MWRTSENWRKLSVENSAMTNRNAHPVLSEPLRQVPKPLDQGTLIASALLAPWAIVLTPFSSPYVLRPRVLGQETFPPHTPPNPRLFQGGWL